MTVISTSAMAIPVGHEFLGTVLEVGPEVTRFRPGDRVLTASVAGCGACDGLRHRRSRAVRRGPEGVRLGHAPRWPGHCGRRARRRLPDAGDPRGHGRRGRTLADRQPVDRVGRCPACRFPPGGTVAVIGLGAVGLCAVRSALALGAARVLAVDPVAGRRAAGRGFGRRGRRGSDRRGAAGGDGRPRGRRGDRRGGEGRDARRRAGRRPPRGDGVGHRGARPRALSAFRP